MSDENDTTTPLRKWAIAHGHIRPGPAPHLRRAAWIDAPTLRLLGNENVRPVSFMRMIELEQRP